MSDIVERLEDEAKARDAQADFLFRKCADEPYAEMEMDYHQSRAALAREAAAEVIHLRSLVEKAEEAMRQQAAAETIRLRSLVEKAEEAMRLQAGTFDQLADMLSNQKAAASCARLAETPVPSSTN